MSYHFVADGECYYTLQYNGDILDTAKGLDDWILQARTEYPRYCFFNAGQSTSLVDGVSLTGQTSGAVIKVGRVVLTGGALGSNTGAGVLFFREVSGKIASGENLRVSTTTYCVAASGMLDAPVGALARALFVQVEANSVRFAMGGATPTNAGDTPANFGTIINANENLMVSGFKNVSTFKLIHAANSANANVNLQVYF